MKTETQHRTGLSQKTLPRNATTTTTKNKHFQTSIPKSQLSRLSDWILSDSGRLSRTHRSSSSSIWCPFPRKVRTIPPNLLGTSSEGEHLGATPRRGKRARDSVRIKFTNLGAAQESASETATVPGTHRERTSPPPSDSSFIDEHCGFLCVPFAAI